MALSAIALHLSCEKLYCHCRAMRCLCMTAERATINLTPVELTGQKPMQPLLGTEHYQCMASLFIRDAIRHHSLHCHAAYETGSKCSQHPCVPHTILPPLKQHTVVEPCHRKYIGVPHFHVLQALVTALQNILSQDLELAETCVTTDCVPSCATTTVGKVANDTGVNRQH